MEVPYGPPLYDQGEGGVIAYWWAMLKWWWTCDSERSFISPLDIHLINKLGYDGFKKNQTDWLNAMRPVRPTPRSGREE